MLSFKPPPAWPLSCTCRTSPPFRLLHLSTNSRPQSRSPSLPSRQCATGDVTCDRPTPGGTRLCLLLLLLLLLLLRLQHYVAPEVIKGKYRPAPADMWSLGVVTYALMSDAFPFQGSGAAEIERAVLSEYTFVRRLYNLFASLTVLTWLELCQEACACSWFGSSNAMPDAVQS